MSNFQGRHALIIDDDPMGADVLANMLARISMTSTVYSNVITGSQDIEAVIDSIPELDVIFLDLEMPGSNGYDVLAMLQENERAMNIPVVAYTTHISHLQQAREAGFHSFLSKPLNRSEFPEQVERILSGESVWVID
jgi:CheY-like chemotaxis protein